VKDHTFQARPGARLIELIEQRALNYADLAIELGMAAPPKSWKSGRSEADEHRERCRVALRAYTHGTKRPGAKMVERWAAHLGVDPGYFFQANAETAKSKPMLFAVHPEFVDGFFDESKLYEFRRRRPRIELGDTILIYATAPRSIVVAKAVVPDILADTPAKIWNLTHHRGIQRPAYDKYFEGRSLAVALRLEVTPLANPVPLPPGQSPPQSWVRWKGHWPLE
jgi:predicted transcriptional regulator